MMSEENTNSENLPESNPENPPSSEKQDSIEVGDKIYQVHWLPNGGNYAVLPIDQIEPSPLQTRRFFDPAALKELAESIKQYDLIEPIVVRFMEGENGELAHNRFQVIAGERRFRSIRDYTDLTEINACILAVDDDEALQIGSEENLRREDLTIIEKIETQIFLIDQQLRNHEDLEESYLAMGETPALRLKILLSKLEYLQRKWSASSDTNNETSSDENKETSSDTNFEDHKFLFVIVDQAFEKIDKHLKWLTFLRNYLPLALGSSDKILSITAQYGLKRSQIKSLIKIEKDFPEEFEALLSKSQSALTLELEGLEGKTHLGEMSGKNIETYYKSLQRKTSRNTQKETRILSSSDQRSTILVMTYLGIPKQRVQDRLGITRTELDHALAEAEILKAEIRTQVEAGEKEISAIAQEFHCSEPLVWFILLEGKGDLDRFDILGWKPSIESDWPWKNSIAGFGDALVKQSLQNPGFLSPLLIAHLLYYFVPEGGMIWVPENSNGSIGDTCLAFGRRCWSWNGNDLRFRRPDIEHKAWNLEEASSPDFKWPVTKERPDLFFAQTEFWSFKIHRSWSHSNGDRIREEYQQQLRTFFQQVYQNVKVGGRLALLVDEERNYENHPASQELYEWRFGEYDYSQCLRDAGWRCTHAIPCARPRLSWSKKERSEFLKNRTLVENNRKLLVAVREA